MNEAPTEHELINEAPQPKRRYSRYLWLVGVCVVAGAVWLIGWSRVRDVLTSVNLPLFLAMLVLDSAAIWVRALKWRHVLGPEKHAIGLHFISKLAGNYSPGRIGELSPLLLRRFRTTRLGAWIVTDRLVEMSVTLCAGAIGFLTLPFVGKGFIPAVLLTLCVFVVAPLMLITRRQVFDAMARRTRDGSFLDRMTRLMAEISGEVTGFKRVAPAACALTIAATTLEIAAFCLMYRAFGAAVPVGMAAAGRCAQGLVGTMPVSPGPTGVPHVVAALFISQAGGFPYEALVLALWTREIVVQMLFWSFTALATADLKRENPTRA